MRTLATMTFLSAACAFTDYSAGESLGTAVATELAARRPCAALVLEAPMSSLADMAAMLVPLVGPLFVRGFNTKEKSDR